MEPHCELLPALLKKIEQMLRHQSLFPQNTYSRKDPSDEKEENYLGNFFLNTRMKSISGLFVQVSGIISFSSIFEFF